MCVWGAVCCVSMSGRRSCCEGVCVYVCVGYNHYVKYFFPGLNELRAWCYLYQELKYIWEDFLTLHMNTLLIQIPTFLYTVTSPHSMAALINHQMFRPSVFTGGHKLQTAHPLCPHCSEGDERVCFITVTDRDFGRASPGLAIQLEPRPGQIIQSGLCESN